MALRSSEAVRRRIDRVIFLGPATVLLVLFFMAPVLVDIGIAFSDMGRNPGSLSSPPKTSRECCRATGD
jgi:ABC-type sugar transport system permease subunit